MSLCPLCRCEMLTGKDQILPFFCASLTPATTTQGLERNEYWINGCYSSKPLWHQCSPCRVKWDWFASEEMMGVIDWTRCSSEIARGSFKELQTCHRKCGKALCLEITLSEHHIFSSFLLTCSRLQGHVQGHCLENRILATSSLLFTSSGHNLAALSLSEPLCLWWP